ncbi:TIGR02710 family CRISPR-associated CARF protein [Micromonospora endolithica]|uniref:TIGR02710 family CRISPR-associated CARF protein n=1 Tax=Micromonospora endolithica TaxID=230091 RepID=UPI0011BE23FD|nr:TIGR02710 family CRISPR-associated CARF protein [Micromonospora endolithica]
METLESGLSRRGRILAREEEYGDHPSPVDAADAYALDHLRGLIAEAVRRNSDVKLDGTDLVLISITGRSPMSTVVAHDVLRPRRLLVIHSGRGEEAVNVIGDYVVGPGRLRHSEFFHNHVDATDPRVVYQIIKDFLSRSDISRDRVILNITGGNKVMSAAAALAAWQLDLELCYVDVEPDPATGHIRPETQRLLLLDNPISIFGDQEMVRAAELLRAGAFDIASKRYQDLSDRLASPSVARFWKAVSDLYKAWCDLALADLPALADRVEDLLNSYREPLSPAITSRIRQQVAFLRRLDDSPESRLNLILGLHILGGHYSRLGRNDFAALLYYRTIEGCLAWRLEETHRGFLCDSPDYTLLGDDIESGYAALSIGSPDDDSGLPSKVSLVAAARLLACTDDDFAKRAGLTNQRAIRNLADLTAARNKSVLAHGFKPIDVESSENLGRRAFFYLKTIWELHRPAEDLDDLRKHLAFVIPPESGDSMAKEE